MNYYGYECIRETDISHHGIKGQRWGVRRASKNTLSGKSRRMPSVRSLFKSKVNPEYTIFEDWYGKDEKDRFEAANKRLDEARRYQTEKDTELTAAVSRYADKYNDSRVHRVYGSGFELHKLSNGDRVQLPKVIVGNGGRYVSDNYTDFEARNSLSLQDKEELDAKMQDIEWDTLDITRAENRYTDACKSTGKAWTEAQNASYKYSKTPIAAVDSAKATLKKAAKWVKSLFKK